MRLIRVRLLGFEVRDQKEVVEGQRGAKGRERSERRVTTREPSEGKSTAQQRASVMCVSSVSRVAQGGACRSLLNEDLG
jgi:hypothetical protein